MYEIADISSYLLGELSEAERAEFERAAAADPDLAANIAWLEPLVQSLRTLGHAAWTELDQLPALAPEQVDDELSRLIASGDDDGTPAN